MKKHIEQWQTPPHGTIFYSSSLRKRVLFHKLTAVFITSRRVLETVVRVKGWMRAPLIAFRALSRSATVGLSEVAVRQEKDLDRLCDQKPITKAFSPPISHKPFFTYYLTAFHKKAPHNQRFHTWKHPLGTIYYASFLGIIAVAIVQLIS